MGGSTWADKMRSSFPSRERVIQKERRIQLCVIQRPLWAERFHPWVEKIPWRRKWQPTPAFLPGESMERGAWWATVHGVTESDMLRD